VVDMSTRPHKMFLTPQDQTAPPQDLNNLLARLEADSRLFERERLQERLDALDELDLNFGDFTTEQFTASGDPRIYHRAKTIRAQMESSNDDVYRSIRSGITLAAPPRALFQWMQRSARRDETAGPHPGFGYDHSDEIVTGILQLREPSEPRLHPLPEMVFYQPTPVRHILHLIEACSLSKDDVFVDIGSGLGHVALLASVLTGARSIGIEVDPAYVACAEECAWGLRLNHAQFICDDARHADLSAGDVFYLYSPFTGSILCDVLERLRSESTKRSLKICAFGPCSSCLAKQAWLRASALPDPRRITVFHTRICS
jgi:histone methylation protein DOT1